MPDAPPDEPPGFDPPHPNGAAKSNAPTRRHAPWEFTVLGLFVALIAIAIILGWTLVGSHSPERLDATSASQVAATCTTAQSQLKALPGPNPSGGAEVVPRIRAEDRVLRTMATALGNIHPSSTTPAAALRGWTTDWSRVIDARERFAQDLETKRRAQFVLPAASGGLKPVTKNMDDFVRENHPLIDACFTAALQLEVIEGPRTYEEVTQ